MWRGLTTRAVKRRGTARTDDDKLEEAVACHEIKECADQPQEGGLPDAQLALEFCTLPPRVRCKWCEYTLADGLDTDGLVQSRRLQRCLVDAQAV